MNNVGDKDARKFFVPEKQIDWFYQWFAHEMCLRGFLETNLY